MSQRSHTHPEEFPQEKSTRAFSPEQLQIVDEVLSREDERELDDLSNATTSVRTNRKRTGARPNSHSRSVCSIVQTESMRLRA